MDTKLVNQKIVLMRKTVPLAVRAIRQKILKTIHQLKARLKRHEGQQKAEQDAKLKEVEKKLKDKLKGKMKQIENIKIVEKDKDYISRLALRHDLKYFRKMLIVYDCTTKENLLATICSSKQIQNDVDKFKQQNPNCDQWLPEALDLLEKKKKNNSEKLLNSAETFKSHSTLPPKGTSVPKSSSSDTKTGDFQKKSVSSSSNTTSKSTEQCKIRSSTGKFQVSPIGKTKELVENTIKKIEPKVAKTESAVIKRLDLSKPSDVSKQIIVEDSSSDDSSKDDKKETFPTVESKRKDAFFLNKNGDAVSSDEEEQDEENGEVDQPITVVGRKVFGNSKQFERQNNNKFNGHNSFGNRKQFSNLQKPLSGGKFERNSAKPFTEFKKEFRGFSDGRGAPGQTPRPKENAEKLHPSWQAKQAEKSKLQHLSFGGTGANKKIKFD